ncbi:PadR family transcriptional regulator [Sphingomonas sp. RP10(2022)]|uniref:PadR family transcriptional regulator n=1 Tax=Sphingomonas liriopis TaxID=2949094 RepID=A0A9X2HV70_9SPHN|nr:PadR family transcriptional regulator [Sphingomonas liriopis]MCP3736124.1 PadR family transcriptional regulator [Sphingomonas liriopis]
MSLPHALLTALAERPCSGSELAARFDRSLGYFWQATHQQIYRELARLEEAGLIKGTRVERARGRKREYRILPAGTAELARWVAEPQQPDAIRDELMVRLRAAAITDVDTLRANLQNLLDHHRAKLELYVGIATRDFTKETMSRAARLRALVLQAGIDFEQQRINICQDAIAILTED